MHFYCFGDLVSLTTWATVMNFTACQEEEEEENRAKTVAIALTTTAEELEVADRREPSSRKTSEFTWPWGDPKKVRDLVDTFAKTSTLHGATYLSSRPKRKCAFFWRALLVFCAALVIASVVSLVEDALGPQSIRITSIHKKTELGHATYSTFPSYPGITLCRMPPYEVDDEHQKEERIMEYAFSALGYPFQSLTIVEKALLFDSSAYPEEEKVFKEKMKSARQQYDAYKVEIQNFSLHHFLYSSRISCETMFRDCIAEIVPLNCCEIFYPILTSLGGCYTLKLNKQLKYMVKNTARAGGFSLFIDLLSPTRIGNDKLLGFSVFVSDPYVKPQYIDFHSGIMVSPSHVATLALSLQMTNRKQFYENWFGFGTCPTLSADFERNEFLRHRYSKPMCDMKSTMHLMKERCQCIPVLDSDENNTSDMRVCEPHDVITCFARSFKMSNLSRLTDLCEAPCIEYTYSIQASYASFDNANRSASKTRIVIHYSSDEYVYFEYRRFTVSTFFSQVGGTMGLLLGASIITVIEFAVFLARWIWYHFIPFKRPKIREEHHY